MMGSHKMAAAGGKASHKMAAAGNLQSNSDGPFPVVSTGSKAKFYKIHTVKQISSGQSETLLDKSLTCPTCLRSTWQVSRKVSTDSVALAGTDQSECLL